MPEESPTLPPSVSTAHRNAAVLLLLGFAVTIAAMAIHPVAHTHELDGFLREMNEGQLLNRGAHALAIAGICVVFCGFIGLADAMGLRLAAVRCGLVAMGVGVVALIAAATINGQILTNVAVRYAELEPAKQEPARALLVFCMAANHACDHLGVIGMSAAVALWSIVFLSRGRSTRTLGILGVIGGIIPVVALLAGQLPMTVHGFGAFVLVQAVWGVMAALWLLRGGRQG
ncbi:MAG: hypothetical protein AABZ53_15900 [Planctomycetota bacterium]